MMKRAFPKPYNAELTAILLKIPGFKNCIRLSKVCIWGCGFFRAGLSKILSGGITELPREDAIQINISEREKLVIKLIADGKSYKEIGGILHLSEGTIRNMLYNLLGRFNLNDRIQLVAFAAKNRII